MYDGLPQFETIRPEEFVRALYYADLSLVAISFGSMFGMGRKKQTNRGILQNPINSRCIWEITLFLMPAGIVFMILGRLGIVPNEFHGIVAMVSFWPPAILLILIFRYGFTWNLLLPMACYLAFVGLQGYHRFMMALPLVFLVGLFLQSRRRRWPNLFGIAAIVLFIIVFPDLKDIGRTYQAESASAALQRTNESFDFANRVNTSDFLDQYAGALTLIDENGRYYYGETYLYAITLPVPRFLWPNKPGINEHVVDISTDLRQYSKEGRAITLIAESYINFGIIGVVVVPFFLGFGLTAWFCTVQAGPFYAVNHYVYLVFFTTLIQVYRDGLSSFLYFGIFQNAPMVALVILHLFFPNRVHKGMPFPNQKSIDNFR